ncbi:MAG: hypothetical protein HY655_07890, partial [Acidobacteria bacterium]|nr:hypothetical protein [Acidobacteriota bacterium]
HALHTEFAAKILEESQSWRLVEAPVDGVPLPIDGVALPAKRIAPRLAN